MMEPNKSSDSVFSTAGAERKAPLNTKSAAPTSAAEIDLDKVLEEMAEIIEDEGGILTP